MRKAVLSFFITFCLLLCGCTEIMGTANVEELLRVPQASQLMIDIQNALNSHKNENVQLKYPRGYKEQSPILLEDIDNDNENEAIILYVSEQDGQRVQLAVLEQQEQGWEVVQDVEGLSSEVMDLQIAELSNGNMQIIVGYANATLVDKYLCIYGYEDNTVYHILETTYTSYLVDDINENNINDLFIVSNGEEEGALIAQWMVLNNSLTGMELLQTLILDSRFVNCNELYFTSSGTQHGIIIEGEFANGWVANEVFKHDKQSESFMEWPQGQTDVPLTTLRHLQNLNVSAFNKESTLMVPTNVTKISTFNNEDRFYFVTWQDYLAEDQVFDIFKNNNVYAQGLNDDENISQETHSDNALNTNENSKAQRGQDQESNSNYAVHPLVDIVPDGAFFGEQYFGVFDAAYGYFVRLPNDWVGTINVSQGATDDIWYVRDNLTYEPYITIEINDENASLGNFVLAETVDNNKVFVNVADNCTEDEKNIINEGVKVIY